MARTIRVYFAEQARTADIDVGEHVLAYVRQLNRVDGVYMASTRGDYLALRPYEHSEPHTVSEPEPECPFHGSGNAGTCNHCER